MGAILALWSASSAVRMAMHALNVAYDVEDRPVWKKFPLSVLYTLVLATLLIVAAGLMFMGPKLIEPIVQPLGLGQVFVTVWSWARIPVAVLLIMLAVALIYWLFPNVKKPLRFITPGAVLAVIVWIVASLGFSFYVANFSSYSATYGPWPPSSCCCCTSLSRRQSCCSEPRLTRRTTGAWPKKAKMDRQTQRKLRSLLPMPSPASLCKEQGS